MKRCIAFCLLLSCLLSLSAQSFMVSDTTVQLEVNTNNGVAHWYTALSNLTNDTVWLRWKQFRASDYPTSSWTTFLQDPQTWYNPVDGVDSGDFYLDTVVDPMDKLVLQVDHHGIADRGDIVFLIFDINNPADSVRVHYEVQINQATGMEEVTGSNWLQVNGRELQLSEVVLQLRVYNLQGQELALTSVSALHYRLSAALNPQLLIVEAITTDRQRLVQKVMLR